MKGNRKLYAMKIQKKADFIKRNLTRYAQTERAVLGMVKNTFCTKLHYAF